MQQTLGKRIIILGNAGAGKTTLAEQLAQLLGCEHIEFDSLYWDPGWTPAPLELFRERISRVTEGDQWVLDGNYSSVRDLLWPRADTVIWLDYPMRIVLWRLLRRTIRRTVGGEALWNGNRERFTEQFFSKDSLFLYVLKTYRRRSQQFQALFEGREYPHLTYVRLRAPRDTERWLEDLVAGWRE